MQHFTANLRLYRPIDLLPFLGFVDLDNLLDWLAFKYREVVSFRHHGLWLGSGGLGEGRKGFFECLCALLLQTLLFFVCLGELVQELALGLLCDVEILGLRFFLVIVFLFKPIKPSSARLVDNDFALFLLIINAKAKHNPSGPLLPVNDIVVLIQNHIVFKDKHLAFLKFAYVVVLAVVLPQLILVSVDLILWEVSGALFRLDFLAKLAADVAEVMGRPVVDVQLILVVEVLGFTEEAVGMLLANMLVEWLILVVGLLKYQYRFVLETELAKVDFVCVHDMVPESFLCREFAGALHD